MISISRTNSSNEVFNKLIKELDADLLARNQELQKDYNVLNIIPMNANVVLCYSDDEPIGCGCIKTINNDVVEVKRVYIKKEQRGKGLSKRIMNELEKWTIELNHKEMILETGVRQIEAINLYKVLGFIQIENYGEYKGNSNSVCMKKILVGLK